LGAGIDCWHASFFSGLSIVSPFIFPAEIMRLAQKILSCFFAFHCVTAFANPATVYVNGDILTMQGDTPQYVEALVVQNDKITFAGDKVQALAQAGANPTLYDLNGRTLMPGFIDSWGHFALIAQNTLGVNVGYFAQNPPQTKAQVIQKLLSEGKLFNGWIMGSGYSEAMLSDGGLSLADIDKAFPDQPLLIQNISTLTGLVNSAGLKKLAITTATKAVGGFILKDPKTGELTGELVGSPFMDAVARAVGTYSQDITFDTYRKAEHVYLSNGFTTAQSYEATIDDMNKMRMAIEQKVISLDLIALPAFDVVDEILKTKPNFQFGAYHQGDRGFKVAGMMVATDGAPQLRFAYFTKPFLDTTGFSPEWRGFPFTPQSTVDHYAKLAYEKNIQYFGYSNGDAGIDMALSALTKAMKDTGVTEDRRPVISHSFFVREDQLAQYKDKKIMAITLSNHTWLYGDVYLKILGEERAKNISPLNSAIKLGVKIGIHNDMPSSGPNVLFSVWSAVNRKTFSGKTLGEEQRITAYQALQGFTVNAAYQYKEETSKGLLAKGMLADLVELDRNPLKVAVDEIKNIRVVQTIKHGKQLYNAQ
jgi:predicted amidohydrolase YtcJ